MSKLACVVAAVLLGVLCAPALSLPRTGPSTATTPDLELQGDDSLLPAPLPTDLASRLLRGEVGQLREPSTQHLVQTTQAIHREHNQRSPSSLQQAEQSDVVVVYPSPHPVAANKHEPLDVDGTETAPQAKLCAQFTSPGNGFLSEQAMLDVYALLSHNSTIAWHPSRSEKESRSALRFAVHSASSLDTPTQQAAALLVHTTSLPPFASAQTSLVGASCLALHLLASQCASPSASASLLARVSVWDVVGKVEADKLEWEEDRVGSDGGVVGVRVKGAAKVREGVRLVADWLDARVASLC